jgi:hypothetical protein
MWAFGGSDMLRKSGNGWAFGASGVRRKSGNGGAFVVPGDSHGTSSSSPAFAGATTIHAIATADKIKLKFV